MAAKSARQIASTDAYGRITCTCGVTSPRLGNQQVMRRWMTSHRKDGRAVQS